MEKAKQEKQEKNSKLQEEVEKKVSSDLSEIEKKLEEQTKKTDEYYEYLQRTMAEFDNYKKRVVKDKESVYETSIADVVEKLLPVMDNFDKAIMAESKDDSFKSGIAMIHTQLKDVLTSLGVTEIGKIGETFDPYLHEAVMHVDDEEKGEKEVCEVFRKGYRINNSRVIRHAMVKVAN